MDALSPPAKILLHMATISAVPDSLDDAFVPPPSWVLRDQSIAVAAQAGLALTHSLPGDASLFGLPDIEAILSEGLDVPR